MSLNGTVHVPADIVTPDNHGGYIIIASALLLVASALVYFLRLGVRYDLKGHFGSDDILITAGTVFGLAQSGVIIVAAKNGLGRKLATLNSNQLDTAEKLPYAADLLYIAAMACARASAAQLVARLTHQKKHMNACTIVSVLIISWGVASILAVSLVCFPTVPWDLSDRCSGLTTSWIAIEGAGIVPELALLYLPIYLVWELQMSLLLKGMVLLAFAFRLPIIPLAVSRIIEITALQSSPDYTFDVVTAEILAQAEMHFCLIAATIPCACPFLKSLKTGFMAPRAEQVDPMLREHNRRSDSYIRSSKARSSSSMSKRRSDASSTLPSLPLVNYMQGPTQRLSMVSTTSSTTTAPQIPLPSSLARSSSAADSYLDLRSIIMNHHGWTGPRRQPSLSMASNQGAEKLVIKKTVGYAVQMEEAPPEWVDEAFKF